MPYVSARFAPPDATGLMPEPEPGKAPVIATDDQGVEWQLTEDSLVGDWLRFQASGGTVLAAMNRRADDEPEPAATKAKKRK